MKNTGDTWLHAVGKSACVEICKRIVETRKQDILQNLQNNEKKTVIDVALSCALSNQSDEKPLSAKEIEVRREKYFGFLDTLLTEQNPDFARELAKKSQSTLLCKLTALGMIDRIERWFGFLDKNETDEDGNTPLHIALKERQYGVF